MTLTVTPTISKAPITVGKVARRRFIFAFLNVDGRAEKRNTEDKSCPSSFLTFSHLLWATSRVWCPTCWPLTSDHRWLLDGAKIHSCDVWAQQPFQSPFAAGNRPTVKKKDVNPYLTRAAKETLMTAFLHSDALVVLVNLCDTQPCSHDLTCTGAFSPLILSGPLKFYSVSMGGGLFVCIWTDRHLRHP